MADKPEVVEEPAVEEVVAPVEEEVVEESTTEPAQEADEYAEEDVEQALASGWKPKDQWQGDPKKWVTPDEYNRRGELFTKIDSLGKDLRDTKKALRMLQDHHSKVKETEYSRALASLREAKKQAMAEGDADAILEVDERLMDMKAHRLAEQSASRQEAMQPDPRFVAWLDKNPWYGQDGEMKAFADDVGIAHAKANPDKSPEDVLKYVEGRIKRTYADKFVNPNRSKPSAVAGRDVQQTEPKASKFSEKDLSAEERRVMRTFVEEGLMTKDQYMADLAAIKGA
jgi:hypothetical protein